MYEVIEKNLLWFVVVPYLICALLFVVVFILNKDKSTTVSHFIARNKKMLWVFRVAILLLSVPVYLTIGVFVRMKYGLGEWFWIPVCLMFVGQELLLLMSDSGGKSTKYHLIGAYGGLAAMLMVAVSVLLFGNVSVVIGAALLVAIVLWVLTALGLFFSKLGKWTLILEMGIIAEWVVVLFLLLWG